MTFCMIKPSTLCCFAFAIAAAFARAAEPAPGYDPQEARARIQAVAPRMSFLENKQIKVGVDLAIGGAITYLAHRDGPNMINRHDWGRQIQMSFYSGPVPFTPNGQPPHPHWGKLGWNPIQSGDVGGHPSRVIAHRNDGQTLFVQCVPMQWPLSGVPGDCTYEWTLSLEGPTVAVRARLVNARGDATPYPAKSQELPALYTNGPWYRLFSYTGEQPFTDAAPVLIPKRRVAPGEFPWNRFNATESWAALVDDKGDGVGIWAPQVVSFLGGFAGKEGGGGPNDGPTGYLAPVRPELLDHNIVYDYGFTLIVGALTDIRSWVYAHAPHRLPFAFRFTSDREHWYPTGGLKDAGWPIQGRLQLTHGGGGKERLMSPIGFWRTEDVSRWYLRCQQKTAATEAELHFETFGGSGAARNGSVRFPIRGDGEWHTYEVTLAGAAEYKGAVRQFSLSPAVGAKAGDTVEIEYIGSVRP